MTSVIHATACVPQRSSFWWRPGHFNSPFLAARGATKRSRSCLQLPSPSRGGNQFDDASGEGPHSSSPETATSMSLSNWSPVDAQRRTMDRNEVHKSWIQEFNTEHGGKPGKYHNLQLRMVKKTMCISSGRQRLQEASEIHLGVGTLKGFRYPL